MALFDVKCKQCGFEEELLIRSSHKEGDLHHCSQCGGLVEKQIGRSSFQLKGRGWARDLYGMPPKKSNVD